MDISVRMTTMKRSTSTRVTAALAGIALLSGAVALAPWIESRSTHYSVFYQPGFEGDATFARAWADSTERLMQSKYGVSPDHYRMSIYLLPEPTKTINP